MRELIGFIGFQADLTDILDGVEEKFGKAPTADKLQQEFYLLGQERMEKIQQFASHLEQKYRKLQTKFPGCYYRNQLKDQLFLAHINIYMILCISTTNKKRQHYYYYLYIYLLPWYNIQILRIMCLNLYLYSWPR